MNPYPAGSPESYWWEQGKTDAVLTRGYRYQIMPPEHYRKVYDEGYDANVS